MNGILAGKMAQQADMLEQMYQKHPEWRGKTFEEVLALIPPRNRKNPLFGDALLSWGGVVVVLS